MFKKYFTEFLGMFFLITAIANASGNLAVIAVGLMLSAMVYIGSSVSGAHFNPAVSFAKMLRGQLSAIETLCYVASQVLGAVCGVIVFGWFNNRTFSVLPPAEISRNAQMGAAILGTMPIALIYLMRKSTASSASHGIAVGLTFAASMIIFESASGGSFNPAIGMGSMIANAFQSFSLVSLLLYLVGPFIGALLACVVCGLIEPGFEEHPLV